MWRFLRNKSNREILSWLGGGLVVICGAAWAVFVFFYSSGQNTPAAASSSTQAECGSIAVGGDVVGGNISVTSRSSDCDGPQQ